MTLKPLTALLCCMGLWTISAPIHAKTPRPAVSQNQNAAQLADVKRLHAVIMQMPFEQYDEAQMERHAEELVQGKIRSLSPELRQQWQAMLNNSDDPSNMGVGLVYFYALSLDAWQTQLQALPQLQTPEYEAVRQKWLAAVRQVDKALWQQDAMASVGMGQLANMFNELFQQYGLTTVP